MSGSTQAPALLAGRSAHGQGAVAGRPQPDHELRAQHGHHRRHHRRLRGYRLGGALLHAQGRVRPEPRLGHRHRADRHPDRPDHAGLRLEAAAGPYRHAGDCSMAGGCSCCCWRVLPAPGGRTPSRWRWAFRVPGAEARVGIAVLNEWLLGIVANYAATFDWIKNAAFYALMLPLRIGIKGCATPAVWGFELTPGLVALPMLRRVLGVGGSWRRRASAGGRRLPSSRSGSFSSSALPDCPGRSSSPCSG